VDTHTDGLPIIAFATDADWNEWLHANHGRARGAWLKLAKKGVSKHARTVTHAEALQTALCHGWIDGQRVAHDENFFLQRFTPRGPRSRWSRINTEHAERLIREGRMTPAGLAEVEKAKADGRWQDAYEPQRTAQPAPDFQAALEANEKAQAFFETLTGQRRYAFIYRVGTIKTPERRRRRIEQYIALLEAGRTLHD
jgi:uncharacterized protein YdeI (YjbR/CyaY-like superfamily)